MTRNVAAPNSGVSYLLFSLKGYPMAESEPLFFIEGCNVQAYADGQHVSLEFVNHNDETRAVVLRREQIPALIAGLQAEIVSGPVIPIDQASLQIGANYRLRGFSVRKHGDGSVRLTLFVELPVQRRTVTLNLPLTPNDVTSLTTHLSMNPAKS